MGLLGPIRKKPKATRFLCMPFIRQIWATEKVYSHTSMKYALLNIQKHIPVSHLCCFLIWSMHLNACVRGYQGSGIQSEMRGGDKARLPSLIIGSTCCAESEAGTCVCVSLLVWWATGSESSKHRPDMPVSLLEQYANPLLNFIFLIPLIRNRGIKPAGRNPC